MQTKSTPTPAPAPAPAPAPIPIPQADFFTFLYSPDDVIEFRFVANKDANITPKSYSYFSKGGALPDVSTQNQNYNVYFGVNPRQGESKKIVAKIKSIKFLDSKVVEKNFLKRLMMDRQEFNKYIKITKDGIQRKSSSLITIEFINIQKCDEILKEKMLVSGKYIYD